MSTVTVAKLSDGRIVELLKHEQTVKFSSLPGWSLVSRPLPRPGFVQTQTAWWVQSTSIVWIITF